MAVEFEVKGTRTSEYLFLPEQLDRETWTDDGSQSKGGY